MKRTFFLALSYFSLNLLLAQSLNAVWDSTYTERPNVRIQHIFQASNGQLVAVGAIQDSEKNKDDTRGVFMLMDSTGKAHTPKYFTAVDKTVYNVFFSAFEAQSGGFYLIGNYGSSETQSHGWVVRVDKGGKILRNRTFEEENIRFERALKNTDESLTLIGQKNRKIAAIQFKKNEVKNIALPKHWEAQGHVLAATYDTTRNLAIAGKNDDKSFTWVNHWDKPKPFILKDSKYEPDNIAAIFTPSGKTFFFGDTYRKGKSNIWMSETQNQLPKLGDKSRTPNLENQTMPESLFENGKNTDAFRAALAWSDDYLILAACTKKQTNSLKNRLCGISTQKPNTVIDLPTRDTLGFDERFFMRGMTKAFDETVLLWGMDEIKNATRVVRWRWSDTLASKNKVALAKGAALFDCSNIRFDDSDLGDGDGIIEAREGGAIAFEVNSRSNIQVQATPLSAYKGITLESPLLRTFTAENGRVSVFFPLSVDDNLVSGQFQVEFTLQIGGQKSKCVATLKCHNPLSKGQDVLSMDIKKNKNEVSDPTLTRERRYLAPPNSNPKVTVVHKAKEKKVRLMNTLSDLTDGNWAYDFELTLNLTEGDNTIPIVFEYEGGVFYDTIRVTYVPKIKRLPNLHVIAIAPVYEGNDSLHYNTKDADDFVVSAKKQEGKGLFDKVASVRKLTTFNETEADDIRKVFRDVTKRSKNTYLGDDAIADNDIVWVLISSHGKVINQRFKVQPSNYDDTNDEEREITTVDYRTDILEKLKEIADTAQENRRKIIVFLDACHSGAAKSKSSGANAGASAILNLLNSSVAGIVTISSTTDSLLSYEDPISKNGAFTAILLKAFNNETMILGNGNTLKPDTNLDGYLQLSELWHYIEKGLPELFRQNMYLKFLNQKQIPFMPLQQLKDDIPILKF